MVSGEALGIIEYCSIGRGLRACDAMLKQASVHLLVSKSLCPGKYLVMVQGSVEDVSDAVAAGVELEQDAVVDSLVLSNPHSTVIAAITQTTESKNRGALGIVESFSMCSCLEAADTAAKRADVALIEIRLALMLAGKGFVTFTGDEAAVKEAVEVASGVAAARGMLVSAVVIARPQEEMLEFLL